MNLSKQAQVGAYGRQRRKYSTGHDGPEQELQELCEDYLRWRGIKFLRIPESVYKRREIAGLFCGWPDLTVLFPSGRYVCIELKRKGGHQRQGQADFEREVGVENYHLVSSFDHFKGIIDARR